MQFTRQLTTISSQEEAQIIYLSAQCAASAYDSESKPSAEEGLSIERLEYIKPTKAGTIKGTSFSLCKQIPGSSPVNPYLPALVVAVRGTDGVVDGMVNANGDSQEARGFFVRVPLLSLSSIIPTNIQFPTLRESPIPISLL